MYTRRCGIVMIILLCCLFRCSLLHILNVYGVECKLDHQLEQVVGYETRKVLKETLECPESELCFAKSQMYDMVKLCETLSETLAPLRAVRELLTYCTLKKSQIFEWHLRQQIAKHRRVKDGSSDEDSINSEEEEECGIPLFKVEVRL